MSVTNQIINEMLSIEIDLPTRMDAIDPAWPTKLADEQTLAPTGTPLSATSTKSYAVQWDGTNFVNALAYERESTAGGDWEYNHFTGALRQWGFLASTTSFGNDTVNLPVSYGNTAYIIGAVIAPAVINGSILPDLQVASPSSNTANSFVLRTTDGSVEGVYWTAQGFRT